MLELKNILVPTDFSATADSAVKYATGLADTFGATVHLLHVLHDPASFLSVEALGALPTLREDLDRDAHQRLDGMLAGPDAKNIAVRRSVRMGNPFVEIIGYAQGHDIDLIVMGTHGRGPITHMLLGSVAEKVVRKSSCPVLTVRPPEPQAP
jgi:nucleotide-binding universal stress UspA family protein